ncbi:MAG: Smr/MutS family protein, partial [Bacteroidota bacterium]
RMLEVVDYVLPEESIARINIILRFVDEIIKYFTPERIELYPVLHDIISDLSFQSSLIDAIEKVLDEEGNIKPDASPRLAKIRKNIGAKQKEMDKQFRVIINDYRSKGWLTDNVESFRNGRRVLSVPSEHKRKIRGIIHDESTTGKTSFIEPEQIIGINNDIFDLEQEEKREIYRILKELSATLRPYAPFMYDYQKLLVRFDVIQSKAKIAIRMDAVRPRLREKPTFGYMKAYHPLLLLKNREVEKVTVPFDLVLHKPNRILLLSGPNAGGKSVTMKAVGLLQLMLQSGMLLPVDEESEVGIFKKIFADIGDQQSLEDDLSTYSSRLRNARTFLEEADRNTLLLIDEFGSGTDPKIGGAIAEAMLFELNKAKLFGVITTHFSNLKIFAYKVKGIVNGAMNFDKDSLEPTFEMRIGRPGSSYAFEIAQKIGLSDELMDMAKNRTGKNEKAVDQLLVDLQKERQEIEEKMALMMEKEEKLDKLIRNYDHLHHELEVRRKRMKLEAKEVELQKTAQDNKYLEKLIREIKESQNVEKAKELAKKVKEEREQLNTEVSTLREQVYYKPTPLDRKKGPIKVGDHVKLRTGGATGQVESIEKGKAVIQMGLMRITAKVKDLQHANAPLEVKQERSINTQTITQNAGFQSKIDIRGMRMEEADRILEDFFDQALMINATHLRVVHGKGSGILRKAVQNKLKEYKIDYSLKHPEPELGGDGVTIIEL